MKENRLLKPRLLLKQKIVLVLFGLGLFLILLELGLRLGGFAIFTLQEYRNLESIKQKGAYRILCLGESTTEGQYPHFLEEILNQQSTNIRFSVVDKGIPHTTTYIVNHLEENLEKYKPDLVVTMMGINDAAKHMPFEELNVSGVKYFFQSFRVYKLIRLIWLRIKRKAQEVGLYNSRMFTAKTRNHFAASRSVNDEQCIELGRVYDSEGEYDKAEELFKKAIELNARNYQAYIDLGWFYIAQGRGKEAQAVYRKAIELDPLKEDGYAGLGWACKDSGEPDHTQAVKFYQQAIELNPRNDKSYVAFGYYLAEMQKYREAGNMFEKAVELNSKNAWAYFYLGWCYRGLGEYARAESAFKRSIELYPRNELAFSGLMILSAEAGKYGAMREWGETLNNSRMYYSLSTQNNYLQLKQALDRRGIKLVCMQYPMRNILPLKRIFKEQEGIIFVDNEKVFKDALQHGRYEDYFRDNFAADFGHCTERGNKLLAGNLANVILKEVFKSKNTEGF